MTSDRRGKYRAANAIPSGVCQTTGKRSYGTRKVAKRTLRRVHQGARMQAYRCGHCGFFHVGHIPDDVRSGVFDKADWKEGMA